MRGMRRIRRMMMSVMVMMGCNSGTVAGDEN